MNTLSIDYPESLPAVLNLSPLEFERDARIALAAKFFEQQRLLNPQTGELERVAVRKRGVDKIDVYGRDIPVKRYTIDTDEVAIDLWYHDELGWVQLVSETGNGATPIYRRI